MQARWSGTLANGTFRPDLRDNGKLVMKLSDYVVQFLLDHGIGDIFLASGGGIMHLLDAVGRNPGINYYCNYHEQACAVSAEGYAHVKGNGVCLVTVGPGAVNALSGIVAAWYDSVPLFVLSGQVRQDLIADYTKIRQFGARRKVTSLRWRSPLQNTRLVCATPSGSVMRWSGHGTK
jgi:hypothetical protein